MTDNVRFGIAATFYATYTIGIVVFAVKPAIDIGKIGWLWDMVHYLDFLPMGLIILQIWRRSGIGPFL